MLGSLQEFTDAWSISKLSFLFHLKNYHSKDVNWKFFGWKGQPSWMYESIMYIAVAYTLLCKLTYSDHNQRLSINIFQMEQLSTVKFTMGYRQNMSFLVILKSPN